jgi:Xaa-Pro aminopeptidase
MYSSNMMVDWQGTLDFNRLREARFARARKELELNDFGAILTMDGWNTKYVTGTYTPQWTIGYSGVRYALFPREGPPILFEQGDIGHLTRTYSPWLPPENIKPAITAGGYVSLAAGSVAHKDNLRALAAQIRDELTALGLQNERLGIDVGDIGVLTALTDVGLDVSTDGAAAMLNARKIKTPDEVECIRMATRIGESMFAALKDSLHPGVSEREVLANMIHSAYTRGAEVYNGVIVESGPTTAPNLRHTAGRLIGPGDMVYADVYNTNWNGYTTCYYRTFSLGEPKKETVKAYDRALKWLLNGIDACRPGNTTRDIAEQFPSAQEAWGYPDEHHGTANLWGHGVGMALYEPPLVWRGVSMDHPLTLEEGMVVALETQDYDGLGQGVRIEEVVRITADGPEVLTQWPIDQISVVDI